MSGDQKTDHCVMGVTLIDEMSSVRCCGVLGGYFSPFQVYIQSNEL